MVAASIVSGFRKNGQTDLDLLVEAAEAHSYLLSDKTNTKNFFSKYNLEVSIGNKNSYSQANIKKILNDGGCIAIRFNKETWVGDKKYASKDGHWIGIIGYRKENGKEQMYISDPGYGRTGWVSLSEFEKCKNNMSYFNTIMPK